MQIILCLAAAMICGLLLTRVVKPVHLPNVTGYLIAGLIIGVIAWFAAPPRLN